jgi:hypothetical protein
MHGQGKLEQGHHSGECKCLQKQGDYGAQRCHPRSTGGGRHKHIHLHRDCNAQRCNPGSRGGGEAQMCFVAPCVVSQLWSLHCMGVVVAIFVLHVVSQLWLLCHIWVTPTILCYVWCWGCSHCTTWVLGSGSSYHVGVGVMVVALYGCCSCGPCPAWVSQLWSLHHMGVTVGVVVPHVVLQPQSLHCMWVALTIFAWHVMLQSWSLHCIWCCGHGHCATCGLCSPFLCSMWCHAHAQYAAYGSGSGSSHHMGVMVAVVAWCVVSWPWPLCHVWVTIAIFVQCVVLPSPLPSLHSVWCHHHHCYSVWRCGRGGHCCAA